MGWFSSKPKEVAPAPPETPKPLGLYLGASVTVDPIAFRVAGDTLIAECPKDTQFVEAVGTIDLGDGNTMYRFYLTDDAFIQVNTENGAVVDSKLFTYQTGIDPQDRAHFDRYLRQGSRLGQPTFELEGKTYERVWGSDTPEAWAPPLVLDETVTKASGSHRLTIYPMLYQREYKPDHYEYALMTGEDEGGNSYCVSIAVGTDLSSADLQVM